MGKGLENLKYYIKNRPKVLQKLKNRGIISCELKFKGCTEKLFCNLAHRYKRAWYRDNKELLIDISHILYVCTSCHLQIEGNDELTRQMFKALRRVDLP